VDFLNIDLLLSHNGIEVTLQSACVYTNIKVELMNVTYCMLISGFVRSETLL